MGKERERGNGGKRERGVMGERDREREGYGRASDIKYF
jgi:hypothetical protein